MTQISRLFGLMGARHARGPTVVVDTFRAFTTAAYLLDSGVEPLVLADSLAEARSLAAMHPGALLCGEDGGARPPGFDLGNSPAEVLAATAIDGYPVVLRTSGGTRCVRAAVAGGAAPVYAASLVVAAATGNALSGSSTVDIVSAGRAGVTRVDEDEVTADYLESLLRATAAAPDITRIRDGNAAHRLRTAPWAHPDDLDLCLDVDRFPFALVVVRAEAAAHSGEVHVRAER